MAVDDLVQDITYHNPRNVLFHGYLAPFFVLQAVVYYYFTVSNKVDSNSSKQDSQHLYENCIIAVVVIAVAQIITLLFCHWSVRVKCLLTHSKISNPHQALVAKITPTPNNGSIELVTLIRETISKEPHLWFLFQKTKYIYSEQAQQFQAAEYPTNKSISHYQNWKGYSDPTELQRIEKIYGRNELEMVIPSFRELFIERATAPFFVFQIFCVSLWCLDEYWYYAVFTLFMLTTFEVVLVSHQIRNMQEIRRMGNKPCNVQVFRLNKWKQIKSDQLVSGDLISITRSENNVPCDILLIKGSCIVDESTLTGESIPQMKEPIIELTDYDKLLNVDQDKLHIIHGGTKVLQHTSTNKEIGCVGYVLKTSFNTSQGKLLRTIMFGVKRITANNFETFCFILFLLFFAVISAIYVWNKGVEDSKKSRYRLFFECTVIVTSVVPPELPIELSLAVNSSLVSLTKLYIYCTEPFRIPFAGKVEYCCFDKTGTLTSDDLIVEGVAGITPCQEADENNKLSATQKEEKKKIDKIRDTLIAPSEFANMKNVFSINKCPIETIQVLASCHSIAHLDENLVGDPMEKKVLEAVDWNYLKSGTVAPKKGRFTPLKIHQRFHFNSTLKRMSAVVSYKLDMSNESNYLAVVKGAPEFIESLLDKIPEDYNKTYLEMSSHGARVLALARKNLGIMDHTQVSALTREDIEKDLTFVGFLLISCPLKPDSKDVCKELIEAGHRLVMITGDGVLTACHVGKMLEFVHSKEVLILTLIDSEWKWKTVTGDKCYTFEQGYQLFPKENLCLTGDSLNYVFNQEKILPHKLVERVKIFARVSPKQKELIITTLKQNHSVLMCGDGTNDVGALKHADVGVALLTTSQIAQCAAKTEKIQKDIKSLYNEIVENTKLLRESNQNIVKKPIQNAKAGKKGAPIQLVQTQEEVRRQKLLESQAKFKEFLQEQDKAAIVKLGDASIAAPFTSRLSSIQCICHIIKQGRCTLVTTLQMFKILALNALLSAYCHSALYVDGIKFSDAQVTIQGFLSTFCFLFISRSQPLKKLSAQRPTPNIFNLYTILTVTLQFFVHFGSLLYVYEHAKKLQGPPQEQTDRSMIAESSFNDTQIITQNSTLLEVDPNSDIHTKFEPSIVNSSIFIVWMSLQVTTFLVNYKGHPFMQNLFENRALCFSITASLLFVVCCVKGFFPDMMYQLSVVPFPEDYQQKFLSVIFANMFLTFIIDRTCDFLFGRNYLKKL